MCVCVCVCVCMRERERERKSERERERETQCSKRGREGKEIEIGTRIKEKRIGNSIVGSRNPGHDISRHLS